MKLIQLHVENFGKLHGFDFAPVDDLTVWERENGWGKTTLAVFIKAMFFGLPATTKKALDENERKKYTPWQGGKYGGNLTYQTKDGTYRIERFFGGRESEDTFRLFNVDTGLEVSFKSDESLGQQLFGIDADAFERSTYFSQRQIDRKSENLSLQNKLNGLFETADDLGNYDEAYGKLEGRKKEFKKTGNKGLIADLDTQIRDLKNDVEKLTRRQKELVPRKNNLKKAEEELVEKKKHLEQLTVQFEKAALVERNKMWQKQLTEKEAAVTRCKQALDDTTAFFGGTLPTAEECEALENADTGIRSLTSQMAALQGSLLSSERITDLRKHFPNGLPTPEEVGTLQSEVTDYQRQKLQIEQLEKNITTEDTRFADGFPTDEDFSSLRKAALLLEEQASVPNASLPSPGSKKYTAVGAAAMGVGFTVGLVGLLAFESIPALIAGTLLLLCGAFVLLKSRKAFLSYTGSEGTATSHAREQVETILKRYGFDWTENIRDSADDFCFAVSEAKRNAQLRAEKSEKLTDLTEQAAGLANKLIVAFGGYGANPSSDFSELLHQYQSDAAGLRAHDQLVEKTNRSCKEKETERNDLTEQLNNAFLRCTFDGEPTFDEKAKQFFDKYHALEGLKKNLSDAERNLLDFSETKPNGVEEGGEELDLEAIKEERDELKKEMDTLEDFISKERAELNQADEEIDQLPELEMKVTLAKDEKETAEEHCKTIEKTMFFLKAAKENLSTRYLPGMRAHFKTYLGELSCDGAPDADLNANLGVQTNDASETHDADYLSRGWRDATDFCLRLSLTAELFKNGEKPFLLLDDPFVNLDDARFDAARSLLKRLSSDYQILYFICRDNRA